jgi:ubiquinone/menaquinone biosynthesis C-methylase UbiE
MYDERYSDEQEAKYTAALTDIAAKGSVLDVGCGTGLFFKRVSHGATNIFGIDISKGLLAIANQRAKKLANVNLIQADVDHLPFKNDAFNMVFAFTVLQNMPKPLETLTEIRRTANKNAVVVVTGLKKTFSKSVLTKLLEEAGLQVIPIKDDDKLACHLLQAAKGR